MGSFIHLRHGRDYLRKLLFRHILKIDPGYFRRESGMELVDRNGLEWCFLNESRHAAMNGAPFDDMTDIVSQLRRSRLLSTTFNAS